MCDPLEFINPDTTSYTETTENIVETTHVIEGDNKNKCGEIYVAYRGTFILICGFCNDKHETMLDFGKHLSIMHEDQMLMIDNYLKSQYDLSGPNLLCEPRMKNNKSVITSTNSSFRLDIDYPLHGNRVDLAKMDNESLKFTCEACGQTYKQKGRLRNHQIRCCKDNSLKHTDRVEVMCKLCNKYFKSTQQLKRHYWRSHKDCGTSDGINEVQATSVGIEASDASCNKFQDTKHVIVLPILTTDEKPVLPHKNHAAEDSNDMKEGGFDCELNMDVDDDNIPQYKSEGNEVACESCGRIFKSKQACLLHVRQRHNTTSRSSEHLQLQSPRCKYCNQEFESILICHEHESTHIGEKRFVCWYCPHQFRTNYGRKRHMRVHTGERPFKCSECPKAFPHMVQLDYHIRKHKNLREFSCQTCDKAFFRKFELTLHERRHTGFRPLVCEDCGKTFNVMSELNEHRKRHSDKKDWKCEVCEKCFYSKWTLKDHMAGHSGETPFACEVCGRKFSRAKALKKHKKLHSDVKDYVCNICGKAYAQDSGLYAHKKTHGMAKRNVDLNTGFE